MNDKGSEKLTRLAGNIDRFMSENGKKIIEESKRIGPGKGTGRNIRKGTHISKTYEEAKAYELYEDAMLGRPIKESELSDEMIDRIIGNVIEDIVNKDILGGL